MALESLSSHNGQEGCASERLPVTVEKSWNDRALVLGGPLYLDSHQNQSASRRARTFEAIVNYCVFRIDLFSAHRATTRSKPQPQPSLDTDPC